MPKNTDHCGDFKWYALWIITVTLLSGCAVSHVSPESPEGFIQDRSTEVAGMHLDRAAVRRVLGAPQFSSTYWGFDLFRTDTEQSELVFAVTPWPIPFMRVKDRLERYTLVTYDANGLSNKVATGIVRRPSAWRSGSPIKHDHAWLHLQAADLMCFLYPQGSTDINMIAAPFARDRYLQRASASEDCMVVLGCGDRGCTDQLSVDDGPVLRLPARKAPVFWLGQAGQEQRDAWLQIADSYGQNQSKPWLEALVALRLPAGRHVLAFSASHQEGAYSLGLDCSSGQVIYLEVDAASEEHFWKSSLTDWRIDKSLTIPARFSRRPLVLLDEGEWYVDDE